MREKRWNKPERGTKLVFEVGELFKLQNPKTKKWDEEGTVQAVRVALDGRILSYDILLSSGGVTVRHRKYLMKTSQDLLTNDSTEVQSADQELAEQGFMNMNAGSMETSREVSRPLSVVTEVGQLSRLRPRQRT